MYGGLFDFNRDGRTDGGELALGFTLMSKLGKEHGTSHDFEDVNSELLNLHDTLSELDEDEPDDCFSEEHDEWGARREDLEEHISDLESTLEDY